ncbi:peptidylprolyl isomerase [Craterilacuibacter sp. RT1T]|uniref:peptidylprolyl isomerase n=1 Tax=Craterilacuibacter sp. RT1T TaxID=2942211 RepID=UPI0020BE4507|nr:peptidylprolyl isomerase [Craterilacuibacter sp. RT1T]MCL6264725.1 peptidylprolyl isomerase [Craterilacuibacter sp. RT1T]
MPITVNAHELTDAEIEAMLPDYQDSANPLQAATVAWVLQRVLLDAAASAGVNASSADAAIDTLLETQVKVPQPDSAACRRHYEQHPARFTVGELVEVDHILFQVTPQVALDALTTLAEGVLAEVRADPDCFADKARVYSNCTSGALGGSLGQLARGETVPEFERVVFALAEGTISPHLLSTRFGLHIVRVMHKEPGRLLPFDMVQEQIAEVLSASTRDMATRQYLKYLVGQAKISGIELHGADSPLLQ